MDKQPTNGSKRVNQKKVKRTSNNSLTFVKYGNYVSVLYRNCYVPGEQFKRINLSIAIVNAIVGRDREREQTSNRSK